DTLHGSGSCRAAVNNDVVSIPPNYPTSTTPPDPLTHTKQRKASFYPKSIPSLHWRFQLQQNADSDRADFLYFVGEWNPDELFENV
ncbi:hypothetical protein, partial [Bifidobacterium longum]|uniref:hypothetical protein n=1 Tax=Bifidobacterium longum TaxID=216816 RepID=UPI001C4DF4C7